MIAVDSELAHVHVAKREPLVATALVVTLALSALPSSGAAASGAAH
jgi:hypothetical protein